MTDRIDRTEPLGKDLEDLDALGSRAGVAWALVGGVVGGLLALLVLPQLLPSVVGSFAAPQSKTWWYLSRASGVVAYVLLAISMLLGLLLSTKFAKSWPGNAAAFALHEHSSLLGLGLSAFHAVVLLGDRYAPFAALELIVPFAASHQPLAVGAGQLAFYGTAILVASFSLRRWIGQRAWRWIHFTSFAAFVLVTAHALVAGSDRTLLRAVVAPTAAILFLAVFRLLAHQLGDEGRRDASISTNRAGARPSRTEPCGAGRR